MPAAVRARRPGWRDPRLWIGILLVTGSVVAGARLLASADDAVGVWAAARDVGAGDTLTADDLVVQRVRFGEGGGLDPYFLADEPPPGQLQLVRGVGAGELVPRAALGVAAADGLVQVPLAVEATRVPPAVTAASIVDVYLVPAAGQECDACGEPVLSGVSVLAVSSTEAGFTDTGQRQVVVAVAPDAVSELFEALGRNADASVTVVRRG